MQVRGQRDTHYGETSDKDEEVVGLLDLSFG